MRFDTLVAIALVFIPFSLTSIGGGAAIVAGIQHETVTVHAWVNSREFLDLFAVSRAAPGPGMMLATVIGWKVAGWLGAFVATLALFVPSSLLCYSVFKLTNHHRDKKWHRAMREGLAPVGIGLIIAGVHVVVPAGRWRGHGLCNRWPFRRDPILCAKVSGPGRAGAWRPCRYVGIDIEYLGFSPVTP